ncbi:hypothetical protein Cfor_07668, partial [Coptotermes formosanus]
MCVNIFSGLRCAFLHPRLRKRDRFLREIRPFYPGQMCNRAGVCGKATEACEELPTKEEGRRGLP